MKLQTAPLAVPATHRSRAATSMDVESMATNGAWTAAEDRGSPDEGADASGPAPAAGRGSASPTVGRAALPAPATDRGSASPAVGRAALPAPAALLPRGEPGFTAGGPPGAPASAAVSALRLRTVLEPDDWAIALSLRSSEAARL